MICFQETCYTGFGDRLRGIAYLLQLADRLGETEVLYNDDMSVEKPEFRQEHFPARLTDLLRIEGMDFDYHPLPLPPSKHSFVYNSMKLDLRLTNRGFRHMSRLRPRDEAVMQKVQELGPGTDWLGLHIRNTDSSFLDQYDKSARRRTLRNLKKLSWRFPARKVFIAADNYRARRYWTLVLAQLGYEVVTNASSFDQSKFRQTSNFDMLVDFFALASCGRVVRALPSEFSRFASWVGGRRLKYLQLM